MTPWPNCAGPAVLRELQDVVDLVRALAYPLLATLGCLMMAGIFGLLEAIFVRLQSLDDKRRAYRLAAELFDEDRRA